MLRIVADLGNSRLKWGRVDRSGRLAQALSLPADAPEAWAEAWGAWDSAGSGASAWAIASVHPRLAERLGAFLDDRGATDVRWFRSAADVPVRHALEQAETAGADRALAVAAAVGLNPPGRPGLVVSCGTAITVERIAADGVWHGGAIAPGLGLSARALHLGTAQLPWVTPPATPPAWGRSTIPALEAGLYWGAVGAVRELLTRAAEGLNHAPWLVLTGGDAPLLAAGLARDDARVVPDLVLDGLARVAFGDPDHG
jgi:type III pantothenate kinase